MREHGFCQHRRSCGSQAGEHGQEPTKLLHVLLHLLSEQLQGYAAHASLQQLMDLLDLAMGEQYREIARQVA